MKKRIGSLFLALSMCLAFMTGLTTASAAPAVDIPRSRTYTAGQFYDVPENAWYAPAVKDCYEMGLMSGSDSVSFDPSGMFTVGQAVTVAARLHNLYQGGNGIVPNVPYGAWYQGAVDYALQNGLIRSGQFPDYDRPITRAQMSGLMVAALPDSALTARNNVTALPDVSAATECSSAIFRLYNAGVFSGSDEYGTFQPYAYITRGEVASLVAKCADPSQRVILNLTPLSQIPPVEIPNFVSPSSYINEFGMSEGLLRVQNTTENKDRRYGYMNYRGEMVTGYQFTQAEDFSNGLAVVRDENGTGVIDTMGMEVVPLAYDSVYDNGLYLIASTRTDCTIFSRQGDVLGFIDEWSAYNYNTVQDLKYADNNPLFVLEDGNKKALATPEGGITEAVYDRIELKENSNFAVLHVGQMQALAGPSGIIFNLGEYTYGGVAGGAAGDYIVVRSNDYQAISDSTGNLSEFVQFLNGVGSPSVSDRVVIAYDSQYGQYLLYNRITGETLSYSIEQGEAVSPSESGNFSWSAGHLPLPDGTYLLLDGTQCLSVKASGVGISGQFGHEFWLYQGLNGKYGIAVEGERLTDSIYSSEEDAFANFGYYKISKLNGKPAVVFGNERNGFTPVIQFYQNGIPYDEIVELGEDYYACRFNETWYLLHA